MLGWWLILVAQAASGGEPAGARVGFEVEEVGEVTPVEASLLIDELAHAVEREAKASVVIQGRAEAPCPIGSARCVGVVPDLVEARLSLRMFGGLSMVRLQAVRTGQQVATLEESADVPRDAEQARGALGELARRLFPVRLAPSLVVGAPTAATAAPPDVAAPAIAPREPEWRPWVIAAVGGAVAMAAAGAAFGASSVSARDAAEAPGLRLDTYESLADRAQAHGWAANILFATAGASLLTGGILFWTDR